MKVLVADPIAEEGINVLRAEAEVTVKTGLKAEDLIRIIGDYDALVVRSETKVTAPVLEAGKKLLVVGRAGVGVDNIDVKAATKQGVMVVNSPTSNTMAAAEHTMALMLSLARKLPQAYCSLKAGEWKRSDFMGVELRNKVLGIVGLGNVGARVARMALAFQMRVIAFDPYVSPDYAKNLGVQLVSMEELLKESDFISLHVPMSTETKGIIRKKELEMVKPTVRIINTARGGLIDEEELYKALEEGRVAGAAVDVFSVEPACDNILCKSDRAIVTPHLGASTVEAQAGVAIDIAQQVLAVLKGQTPMYAVNSPFIPRETQSVILPYLSVANTLGRFMAQLQEGQPIGINARYEGEIANYDTTALKAALLGGLLDKVTEERVNIVNANMVAQSRGLKVQEYKGTATENFASLITVEVSTTKGKIMASGTHLRGEPHIVRLDEFWFDIIPTGGYFLFCDHRDRPGLIAAVGTITGNADINIHSMHLSRIKPRGKALMVLGLDEALSEENLKKVRAIPDVNTARLVKL